MVEVTLTFPTPEGLRSIVVDGEKMSFGRGSEADQTIDDDGLSRLHAIVYRDGSRVWIVDHNSTNGTLVNGEKTAPAGTPLRSGDRVKIGNHTVLTVQIAAKTELRAEPVSAASTSFAPVTESGAPAFNILPVAVIAIAVLVISLSAVFIGYAVLGSGGTDIVINRNTEDDPADVNPRPTPTPKSSNTPSNTATPDNNNTNDFPINTITGPPINIPSGKKYLEMTDTERRQYLEAKAMRIAQVIGNNSSESIPAAAIDKIKGFADGFASRLNAKGTNGCSTMRPWGDSLQATYERASKNAPFIVRAFNEKGIDSRIGLYLAMIESEHCVCLQSGTGPLGMFQFTYATAKLHFEPSGGVIKGASPSNPDERCKPEAAARAAASYMKALTGRYGTGPASVPLAIGSYNSGEGGLSSNLQKALDSNAGLPRDFWTLIAQGDKLSKQFQAENFKYVPKFFAAAIIGENPQDFGLHLQPVSTYSK